MSPLTTACNPARHSQRGPAQHRDLGGNPRVGPDPHRALDDALVLDRQLDVVHPVVEVADVAPVRHQHRVAQLDAVGVDDVVAAEHHLVAETQRTLMAADGVLVADMDPASDLHRGQLRGCLDLHALAEDHAARDDVRVLQFELQQPPVAHQIPPGACAIGQHPLQRRQRQEPRLARIPQSRTPPPLVQRHAPAVGHQHSRKPTRAHELELVTLTWAS